MVAPSLVHAAASAAFPVVMPAVPSYTTMFLVPSVAPSVAPPCPIPSVPQWPPFAQAQIPQLATVPARQGIQTFPGTPSLFFS